MVSVAIVGSLLIFTESVSFAACPTHTGEPTTDGAETSAPKFNNDEYLTGDWFGLRNTLYDFGIEINGGYTTEPAGNPVGGLEQGGTYLHNFGFAVVFDLQKIFALPASTLLVTVSQRSGDGLTQEYIGNAISVQQIFGGGQTYRLVQVRMEHHLFDGWVDVAYGRITATADFMSSPFYCQFVNNGICGQPPAPFFNMPNGITAYPQGTWGGLVKVQTSKETYAKVAVYDGDPNRGDDAHGTNFGIGQNGVLLLTEVGYKSSAGLWGMPSRYSFGGYYHTGEFPDVARDDSMTNLFLSGRRPAMHSGQEGFYLVFEQMFFRNSSRPETGLNGFVTFVLSPDEDKSAMPYYLNGGLIWEGLIPCRPNDKAALGFYSAWFSNSLRSAQQQAHLPSQKNETNLELNYQVQLTKYLYLRPNIQYVIRPNGLNQIENALVLGTEVGVTF